MVCSLISYHFNIYYLPKSTQVLFLVLIAPRTLLLSNNLHSEAVFEYPSSSCSNKLYYEGTVLVWNKVFFRNSLRNHYRCMKKHQILTKKYTWQVKDLYTKVQKYSLGSRMAPVIVTLLYDIYNLIITITLLFMW